MQLLDAVGSVCADALRWQSVFGVAFFVTVAALLSKRSCVQHQRLL
jgi:hypothetical protein